MPPPPRSRCRPISTRASRSARVCRSREPVACAAGCIRHHPCRCRTTSRFRDRGSFARALPDLAARGPWPLPAGRAILRPVRLRLAEHIAYVRRDLGFNQLQESYNVSTGGVVLPRGSAHHGLRAGFRARHRVNRERSGGLSRTPKLRSDTIALGGQSRLAFGIGVSRFVLGSVAKWHVEKLQTLFPRRRSQRRVVDFLTSDVVGTRAQFVGAAGFAVLPVRGLMIICSGERNQSRHPGPRHGAARPDDAAQLVSLSAL